MRYYISDLHFFHRTLLTQMDCRGFATVEEMHEQMISVWNRKVHRTDEVVILGDVSFGDVRQTNEILSRLKGKLYLIEGNHDEHFLKDKEFDAGRFEWIRPYAELHDHGYKVVLCHYPILCYNGQYHVDGEGNPKSYMLYGHVHLTRDARRLERFIRETGQERYLDFAGQERTVPCSMINCFCMRSGYEPLTLKEWIRLEEKSE